MRVATVPRAAAMCEYGLWRTRRAANWRHSMAAAQRTKKRDTAKGTAKGTEVCVCVLEIRLEVRGVTRVECSCK